MCSSLQTLHVCRWYTQPVCGLFGARQAESAHEGVSRELVDVVTRAVAKLNINWLVECYVEPQRDKLDERFLRFKTCMRLADAFIQSDLQCHLGYTFFCQYVCSLGIEPTTFCTANAMIYHWATGKHRLHLRLPFFPDRSLSRSWAKLFLARLFVPSSDYVTGRVSAVTERFLRWNRRSRAICPPTLRLWRLRLCPPSRCTHLQR